MKPFRQGFISVIPLISGIVPFGAVMGSAFAEANLSFFQAMVMNMSMYAGAAQLATNELMKVHTATFVVVITGIIINLRFLLYSAAMSPYLEKSGFWTKFFCAFNLTDQSYASMTANYEKFKTNEDAIRFYIGTAVCMAITWHISVVIGFFLGNIAPASLNLDYAIPLSFVALLIPTLKTNNHRVVAIFSSICAIAFHGLPMRSGLMVTAVLAITLSWFIIQKKYKND